MILYVPGSQEDLRKVSAGSLGLLAGEGRLRKEKMFPEKPVEIFEEFSIWNG